VECCFSGFIGTFSGVRTASYRWGSQLSSRTAGDGSRLSRVRLRPLGFSFVPRCCPEIRLPTIPASPGCPSDNYRPLEFSALLCLAHFLGTSSRYPAFQQLIPPPSNLPSLVCAGCPSDRLGFSVLLCPAPASGRIHTVLTVQPSFSPLFCFFLLFFYASPALIRLKLAKVSSSSKAALSSNLSPLHSFLGSDFC
jgi:hypothetical protein